MCKEKLKVEKDWGNENNSISRLANSSATNASSGLGGILNKASDENCYFIEAKRLRISYKNEDSKTIEKKEVTVHIDCFK